MPTFTRLAPGKAKGLGRVKVNAAMEQLKDYGRYGCVDRPHNPPPVYVQAKWNYEPGKVTLVKAKR